MSAAERDAQRSRVRKRKHSDGLPQEQQEGDDRESSRPSKRLCAVTPRDQDDTVGEGSNVQGNSNNTCCDLDVDGHDDIFPEEPFYDALDTIPGFTDDVSGEDIRDGKRDEEDGDKEQNEVEDEEEEEEDLPFTPMKAG
ncbi:hypothetical protein V5O48_016921 [Marasmius crinis-equi]|uniref:Uncharacterized protein n=1 Tax=Marasmius crinis-equi TaxID=585013 RepID=A0ABR3EQE2_9AGAR